MTIYEFVNTGDYYQVVTIGLFSTRRKAETAKAKYLKIRPDDEHDLDIIEHELNEWTRPEPIPPQRELTHDEKALAGIYEERRRARQALGANEYCEMRARESQARGFASPIAEAIANRKISP